MRFTIKQVDSYLRADLYDRETAEETRQFLDALMAEAVSRCIVRILIFTHSSRALFRALQSTLSAIFEFLASQPAHRVALVADTREVQIAQEYGATLATQKGLTVKSFAKEDEAIAWLKA